jgi:hypothetical protein
MRRSTKIILLITIALAAAIGLLSWANRGDLALKHALSENGQFLLAVNGKTVATITMKDLEEIGLVKFETTMDTSLTDPKTVTFTEIGRAHV